MSRSTRLLDALNRVVLIETNRVMPPKADAYGLFANGWPSLLISIRTLRRRSLQSDRLAFEYEMALEARR